MASHSSILAWRIPWTEKPGGLQSTGSHRVRHDRLYFHRAQGTAGRLEGRKNSLIEGAASGKSHRKRGDRSERLPRQPRHTIPKASQGTGLFPGRQ